MNALQSLSDNFIILLIIAGCFGLILGSFLNVVIYRIPKMLRHTWLQECVYFLKEEGLYPHQPEKQAALEKTRFNLAWPASHCPACEHRLRFFENIPLLSFIWQKGRCRHCQAKISLQYPIVEGLTALVAVLTLWYFGFTPVAWMALLLGFALIVLSFIDLNHQILPDNITLPMLWFGLFINIFFVFTPLKHAVIGAIAGYLSLWLVYQLFKLLTKKEGMGFGDFKLLAMLGAWMGWQMLPLIIILSSLMGAVVGLGLILFKGHDKAQPIPFGPYIALAGWISLLWGDMITSKYFSLMGIQYTL